MSRAIVLRITLEASAKAAADLLAYIEVNTNEDDVGAVTIESVEPRGLPAASLRSGRTGAKRQSRRRTASRQAPGTPISTPTALNPFVVQAVEGSTPGHGHAERYVPSATATGRNRVVYMLTNPAPEDAVIFGQPRQILDLLSSYPDGLSAKEVETISRLKQKSVESALYSLRTQGVVHSVSVEDNT